MSNPSTAGTGTETPAFSLAQIFLQRAAFSYRRPPLTLPADTRVSPQQVTVMFMLQHLNDGAASQVIVRIATNPEDGDETVLYDFEVEMVAVVHEINRAVLGDRQLIEAAATMLYPFIRETVANLTGRGRFGPVLLNPYNVRAAVQGAVRQQDANSEAEKENPTP